MMSNNDNGDCDNYNDFIMMRMTLNEVKMMKIAIEVL
jgi:hypothetical protein